PRVCQAQGVAHIYFRETGAPSIWCAVVTPSTRTVAEAAVLISTNSDGYDVTLTASGDALIVWADTDASVRWAFVAPTGTLGSPGNGYPAANGYSGRTVEGPVAVATSGTGFVVAYVFNDGLGHHDFAAVEASLTTLEVTNS